MVEFLSQVKPNEVVDKWYSEVKDHKFGEEPKGTMLKSGEFVVIFHVDSYSRVML